MNDKAREQVAACVEALDELVAAVLRHDEEKQAASSGSANPVAIEYGHDLDIEQAIFNLTIKQPVRQALKAAINKIGQIVYERGGRAALDDTIDQVSKKDPATEMRRASIIDSAWNGVGKDNDKWWS